MRRSRRRGLVPRLVVLVNVAAIGTALAAAYLINSSYGRIQSIDRVALAGTLTPADAEAASGDRVLNVLLVGSDSAARLDEADPINEGRQGERNGDVIIVAHIDERTASAALLSIPRDLWVPVADRDREAKINSAFAVGGPAMLIDTIEEHLGIPIHHYVNVDFAGFQGLVDALGHVDVWFDRPARDFNPQTGRSQTGFLMPERGCQALDGQTALAYVRSRYYQTLDVDGTWVSEPASDLNRIARQQDFLRQLVAEAISRGSRNPFVFDGLVDAAVEHVTLDQDLTPGLLLDLGEAFDDFESDNLEAYSLPADFGWVGSASVLFADERNAEPLLALFAGAEPTDPATVRVELAYDPTRVEHAESITVTLERAGFEDVAALPAPLGFGGIEIRHGPNARQAGELVAAAVGGEARIVEVGGLPGRTVVVALGSGVAPDTPDIAVAATSQIDARGFTRATCGR